MFALSLLVPSEGVWHWVLVGAASFCALLFIVGLFLPSRDRIKLEFGTPTRKRHGWTVRHWRFTGGAHAASATSSATIAGTVPAEAGHFEDREESAIFVYLPVINIHGSDAAEDVEATFTFEDVAGTLIRGPWSVRWMNAKNPGLQHPLTNPESYRRMRIPAGSEEQLDLVYFGDPGRCYVYTDESARSGVKFDPDTEISDSGFRIRIDVRAPRAARLTGTFWVEWEDRELEIRREA